MYSKSRTFSKDQNYELGNIVKEQMCEYLSIYRAWVYTGLLLQNYLHG